ncbi:MAG: hypothetical protein HC852_11660 [Acaryochloridaceae cyanobacterium RU_4_10]|nr:hypothetical protein [Acaryochloridaceae cyanobacterium RU_4_10]
MPAGVNGFILACAISARCDRLFFFTDAFIGRALASLCITAVIGVPVWKSLFKSLPRK